MFEVCVKSDFKASHQLRYLNGECERLHGHNWLVEVIAERKELDVVGVVIDFEVLKKRLAEVLKPFDHARLNYVPPFDKVNPTAENVARYLHDKLMEYPDIKDSCRIKRVTVGEAEDMVASYLPDSSFLSGM
jgi:6-pyruvoyltetrahydropterin/6-carboxytetrahydropterin synthase